MRSMTTPNEEFEYTEIEPATEETAPVQPTSVEPTPAQPTKVKGSIAASTWIALIIGFLLLILLIVFILQNQQSVELNIFAWSGAFPPESHSYSLLLAEHYLWLLLAAGACWSCAAKSNA